MNFFKFHLGDYYKKTSHLSMIEDGAYRRLMDAIYLRECPLPRDKKQIYRLVKASTKAEKIAVDSVLAEFFTLTDEGYSNPRCDEEIASVREKSAKAAQSANARWSDANASAIAQQSNSVGNASHKPLANKVSTAHAREPVSSQHRVLALDLLDRGKAQLTGWERTFLEDLCKRATITDKARSHLDNIATKIGYDADAITATWVRRLEVGRSLKQWDSKWGPMPGKLGCLVPDQLLEKGDGESWAIWKPGDAINTPPSKGDTIRIREDRWPPLPAPAKAIQGA